jgi:predicted amino acid dehydrogenase
VKKPTCLIIDDVDPDDLMEGVKLIKIVENYIRSGTVKYQKKIDFNAEEVDKNKPKFKLDKPKAKNVVQNTKKHKEVKRPIIMV